MYVGLNNFQDLKNILNLLADFRTMRFCFRNNDFVQQSFCRLNASFGLAEFFKRSHEK